MEFSTGGGALRFLSFVVSCCEESLEAGPSFLLCRETFPGFSVVDKDTGLVEKLEGDANDLLEAVGIVTGGGVVTAIFDPVEKGFNWLVYVKRVQKTALFSCRSVGEMLA